MTEEAFRFSSTVKVRWRDVDALGHVNNAVYFTYLEQARVDYLRELGLATDDPQKVSFILAQASCQFKSPIKLGERVTVYARVSELGNSSFSFDYRMTGGDGRLIAVARSVQVCYDYARQKPVPIPEAWRQIVTAYEPGL
ncbi:MAG TPA: acyl-CoA thioesterase [Chloroflexi bacterium]|nr:acyl-CoA thioesterase [Chloroflexota bacterium]